MMETAIDSSAECTLHPGDRVEIVDCPEAKKHIGKIWTVASKPHNIWGAVCVKLYGFAGQFNAKNLKKVWSTQAGAKFCGNCNFFKPDGNDGFICENAESDHGGGWTADDNTCRKWEAIK